MKRRFRIFSIKRLLLSIVLGFLIPASYAFALFKLGHFRRSIFEVVITPIRWPLSLVMFLLGREPSNEELPAAFVFLIVCNIALYGSLIYLILLAVAAVRRKRESLPLPPLPLPLPLPPPDSLESDATSSG
jgi:hypothetical protein